MEGPLLLPHIAIPIPGILEHLRDEVRRKNHLLAWPALKAYDGTAVWSLG